MRFNENLLQAIKFARDTASILFKLDKDTKLILSKLLLCIICKKHEGKYRIKREQCQFRRISIKIASKHWLKPFSKVHDISAICRTHLVLLCRCFLFIYSFNCSKNMWWSHHRIFDDSLSVISVLIDYRVIAESFFAWNIGYMWVWIEVVSKQKWVELI